MSRPTSRVASRVDHVVLVGRGRTRPLPFIFRIRPGDAPPAMVFGVRSLPEAIDAARVEGLETTSGDQARLDPSDTLGLDLRFEETPPKLR